MVTRIDLGFISTGVTKAMAAARPITAQKRRLSITWAPSLRKNPGMAPDLFKLDSCWEAGFTFLVPGVTLVEDWCSRWEFGMSLYCTRVTQTC